LAKLFNAEPTDGPWKYGPSDIPESERNANVVTRHINRRDNGVMRSSKVMPMLWTWWWNDDDMRTVPMDTALGNMSDNFYSVEVPSTTSSASHRTVGTRGVQVERMHHVQAYESLPAGQDPLNQ
jgi:hypothetical protein